MCSYWLRTWRPHMNTPFAYAFAYIIKQTPYAFVAKIILCMYLLYDSACAWYMVAILCRWVKKLTFFIFKLAANLLLKFVCSHAYSQRRKSYHFWAEIASKMVTFSPRNTNIYKICKLRKAIFPVFYNISPPNFAILLTLGSSFYL